MVIAAATLLVVIRPRPRGEANRLVRVFVEGLLEKLGTGQAVMDPAGLPAAFGDGRDARQPRGTDRPRAGETREEVVIRVGREDGGDLVIEGLNGVEQAAELSRVGLDHQPERGDDRGVGREGGRYSLEFFSEPTSICLMEP